jgi:ABC-2 type transport system permease protein
MNALAGATTLTRLALRRDRLSIALWVLSLAGFLAATASLWARDLRDPAVLVAENRVAAANVGIRMLGLASGSSVGAYAMVRDFLLIAVLAALMSVFTVVRHTRQSEETGRAELVGAAVVGRHAGLAAGLVVAVFANVVLTVAVAFAMIGVGQPVLGSFMAGAAVAVVGVSFAGIAAVTTQLTSSTRGASGIAAGALGVAFLASGIGNMTGELDASGTRVESTWPAWLSPLGWGQQMRPYGGDNLWPIGLGIALFLGGTAVAAWLASRRDFGHGLLPQRGGRGDGGRSLRSTLGLAWRMQRGTLVGWAVGLLLFSFVMGGLIDQIQEASGAARDWYARMGGSDQILDAYRSSVMQMAAMAAAIYVVQVLLRMRTDETEGTLESVLAAAVSRWRWVAAYVVNALLGATALVLLFGVGMGATAGATLGNPLGNIGTLIAAGLVQLPGIMVIGALVVVALALLPRFANLVSWGVLMASILLGPLFGPTLRAPQWVQDLSPFTHVPKAPAVPVTAGPVLGLLAVVLVLGLAGLAWLRRRDLALPA